MIEMHHEMTVPLSRLMPSESASLSTSTLVLWWLLGDEKPPESHVKQWRGNVAASRSVWNVSALEQVTLTRFGSSAATQDAIERSLRQLR